MVVMFFEVWAISLLGRVLAKELLVPVVVWTVFQIFARRPWFLKLTKSITSSHFSEIIIRHHAVRRRHSARASMMHSHSFRCVQVLQSFVRRVRSGHRFSRRC